MYLEEGGAPGEGEGVTACLPLCPEVPPDGERAARVIPSPALDAERPSPPSFVSRPRPGAPSSPGSESVVPWAVKAAMGGGGSQVTALEKQRTPKPLLAWGPHFPFFFW